MLHKQNRDFVPDIGLCINRHTNKIAYSLTQTQRIYVLHRLQKIRIVYKRISDQNISDYETHNSFYNRCLHAGKCQELFPKSNIEREQHYPAKSI